MSVQTVFKVVGSYTNFYTGGPISLFSTEEKLICSCGDAIKVVDLQTAEVVKTLEGDSSTITAFALDPTDKYLVSCGTNQQLKFWDLETGICKATWKAHNGPVTCLTYDTTSTLVASSSVDQTVKVWDVEHGFCTHNFRGHKGIVTLVRFHPDPQRLLLFSCGADCTVRMWNLKTKKSIVFEGHLSVPTSINFSPSGDEIITGGRDQVLIVWNCTNNTLIKTIPVYESLESAVLIHSQKFAHKFHTTSSEFVITAGEKGKIRMWEAMTDHCVFEENAQSKQLQCVLMHGKTNKIITVNSEYMISIYDIPALQKQKHLFGTLDEVLEIKYLHNEEQLVVVTNSEQVRVYNAQTRDVVPLDGHTAIVICADVSAKLNLIATGAKDSTVRLWDGTTLECITTCVGHTESVGAITFAKRGTFLLSASSDKTIKMWECEPPTNVREKITLKAHDQDVNTIAVSPNDKFVATGSQDKTIKLWSSHDLGLLATLRGHSRGVWCVEFSPADQCLASSSSDKTIKLWSITNFTCLKTFEGHINSVLRVSFLAKGTQLLSSSADGLLKVWSIKTTECVNTFDAHTDKVWALAVNKNQDQIISGGSDSIINIWRDFTQVEQDTQQQQRQERILKEQELLNSLHHKNFKNAVSLAFTLEQPFKMLTIFESALDAEEGLSEESIKQLFSGFSVVQLETFFRYLRDWNTNSKHSAIAQRLLKLLFSQFTPNYLTKLPNMKEILEGLIPYTERHFSRMDRLLQRSFLLDYTLQRMELQLDNTALLENGNHQSTSAMLLHEEEEDEEEGHLSLKKRRKLDVE